MRRACLVCVLVALFLTRSSRAAGSEARADSLACREIYSSAGEETGESSGGLPKDQWLGPDKLRHLATSVILTGMCFQGYDRSGCRLSHARGYAALSALGLGILKEERDRRKTYFSWKDLVADIVGIGVGVLVLTY